MTCVCEGSLGNFSELTTYRDEIVDIILKTKQKVEFLKWNPVYIP